MACKPLPDVEILRQLLDYDPESGNLYWKERAAHWFAKGAPGGSDAAAKMWNKKFAGQLALNAVSKLGYRTGSIFNKRNAAHRVIWILVRGDDVDGVIDHVDGDRANNALANLRMVSRSLNQRNLRLSQGRARLGVYKVNRRWRVLVANKHMGYFATEHEAMNAAENARLALGFTSDHGFPR